MGLLRKYDNKFIANMLQCCSEALEVNWDKHGPDAQTLLTNIYGHSYNGGCEWLVEDQVFCHKKSDEALIFMLKLIKPDPKGLNAVISDTIFIRIVMFKLTNGKTEYSAGMSNKILHNSMKRYE